MLLDRFLEQCVDRTLCPMIKSLFAATFMALNKYLNLGHDFLRYILRLAAYGHARRKRAVKMACFYIQQCRKFLTNSFSIRRAMFKRQGTSRII